MLIGARLASINNHAKVWFISDEDGEVLKILISDEDGEDFTETSNMIYREVLLNLG